MKLKELRTLLKPQKISKNGCLKGIERALAIPQDEVKKWKSEKLKKKDYILPFISTHNPNNPNVLSKVRKIYGNLQTSKTLGKIFAEHKLIDFNLQTFQQISQLSKQQNAEFLLLWLYYRGIDTNHLFWNLISTAKLPTLYM